MTNSKRLRKACSLRAPKSPALLGPPFGSFYGHLEDSELSREADGATTVWGAHPGVPEEEAAQKPAGSRGSRRRRAASLKIRRAEGEEDAATEEAAHSLGPGDGHKLIVDAPGKAEGKAKKCKKQVSRALRLGWEIFLVNVSSLTLSRSNRVSASSPSRPTGAAA